MLTARVEAMDTSLVTSPAPDDMSPIEAAIMDGCNALHAARASGDEACSRRIRAELFDLLDHYDATDGEDHPNPAWSRPNQRALVHSAAGELDAAIRFEIAALPYADTNRRKEISLGNLAERCIRAGRHDDAVEWFLLAQEIAPHRVPILLTGAQALFFAGYLAEADQIFASMLDMTELLAVGSELTAYLDYEPRLRVMAAELPSLAELYRRWNKAQGR